LSGGTGTRRDKERRRRVEDGQRAVAEWQQQIGGLYPERPRRAPCGVWAGTACLTSQSSAAAVVLVSAPSRARTHDKGARPPRLSPVRPHSGDANEPSVPSRLRPPDVYTHCHPITHKLSPSAHLHSHSYTRLVAQKYPIQLVRHKTYFQRMFLLLKSVSVINIAKTGRENCRRDKYWKSGQFNGYGAAQTPFSCCGQNLAIGKENGGCSLETKIITNVMILSQALIDAKLRVH
jgi:hypothetical protein